MFKQLKSKLTFPQMEDETIKFWKENKIFERSVNERSKDNLFVFYDGPPFISGMPHYGHLLGSIAKDIIPRYQTMKGKRVERVWGWDAHGLTVENKVQKKHNIRNRKEIEDFGIEKFIKECEIYTAETSAEWDWYIDKVGRFVDMKNAYRTTDQDYMESVIWAFKELYDKGLIYEGLRTSLFCTTCGTPISNFEVAMDNSYKDMTDPAITVKFEVTTKGAFKGAFILAWTTTPWTIPSNRALAVDDKETYVMVEVNDEKLILAKKRIKYILDETTYKILDEFKGEALLGVAYIPPFSLVKPNEKEYKVYCHKGMVNMEEGTGIVHSAPGYGEIDTEMGNAIGLNVMTVVNDEGIFVDANEVGLEQEKANPFVGMYYKKADKYIIEDLIKRNLLFKQEKIVHRFPYHDRCDTPLVYKAQNSWFIDVASLKGEMIENNKKIKWVPKHLKNGRFGKGIEQAPDWCISRNRYWATPMPIWESEDGDKIVIGSRKELEELSGRKVKNFHIPYIDEIEITKNGKVYKRRKEVLDSWFEAGSMPYAQIHYPFENEKKFEDNYPGDYIVEYIAQTRAWFYVLHVLSTSLFKSNSFKNVVTTGVMAGNDGRKMSKTYGNYTDPKELLETIGGDALRIYLMGSPLMVGENANFDENEIRNKVKNVLYPLWNSLRFFLIYAEIHKWSEEKYVESTNNLDIWIKTRLEESLIKFSESLDNYYIPLSVKVMEKFVLDLSTWYVRRSRDRFAEGDNEAFSTLYSVLLEFSKGFAPLIPFITESIYQELSKSENEIKSVHLELYPELDKNIVKDNKHLIEKMQIVRDLVALGQAARVEAGIRVKQPLAQLFVVNIRLDKWQAELIKDELNVKKLVNVSSLQKLESVKIQSNKIYKIGLDIKITKELFEEGMLRDFMRQIQSLRKKAGLQIGEVAKMSYCTADSGLENFIIKYKSKIKASANLSDIIKVDSIAKKYTIGKSKVGIKIEKDS